jgi:predicted Rossmann fold flavoprotein
VKNYFDVVVIGGGPAGMMAAIAAATNGVDICLLERNSSLGQKLLLTGKGRCNLTTNKTVPQIVEAFGQQGKFLYSALARFSNTDLIKFFNSRGVATKLERGGRIFPATDTAVSILNCLKKELSKLKVNVIYNFRAVKITQDKDFFKLLSSDKKVVLAKKIILATGGKSYPATGSTGDGYRLATSLGHKIIPPRSALVPLIVKDEKIRFLAGLTLKNVRLSFLGPNNKQILSLFGEMLFTHKGISGPIVLTASKTIGLNLEKGIKITASIDLKPVLDIKTLRERIWRERQKLGKNEYQTLLKELFPKSLIPIFILKSGVKKHKKVAELTKEEIDKTIATLKDFSFSVDGVAPVESGIVTAGGVDITQIDSRSMASRVVPGLYFAGEAIGLDGPTGGFNLQKAFSTGWLAGYSTSSSES